MCLPTCSEKINMLIDDIKVKTIPGFHNYAISRDGKVWSKPRVRSSGYSWPGGWLKKRINRRGYEEVHLRKNNKHFYRLTHRLILITYIGFCPKDIVGRHLDGNSSNNQLRNLAYGTQSENIIDSVRHGTHDGKNRKGSKHPLSKLTEQNVRMIHYIYRTGLFLQREIAKMYDVTESNISSIIRRRTWCHI